MPCNLAQKAMADFTRLAVKDGKTYHIIWYNLTGFNRKSDIKDILKSFVFVFFYLWFLCSFETDFDSCLSVIFVRIKQGFYQLLGKLLGKIF